MRNIAIALIVFLFSGYTAIAGEEQKNYPANQTQNLNTSKRDTTLRHITQGMLEAHDKFEKDGTISPLEMKMLELFVDSIKRHSGGKKIVIEITTTKGATERNAEMTQIVQNMIDAHNESEEDENISSTEMKMLHHYITTMKEIANGEKVQVYTR